MQPDPDDLQAICRLKRGDIGGLDLLISRYQGKAIRTPFLITHDELMAEDVVQDVFVHFYQRARNFDKTRPFEPYLLYRQRKMMKVGKLYEDFINLNEEISIIEKNFQ